MSKNRRWTEIALWLAVAFAIARAGAALSTQSASAITIIGAYYFARLGLTMGDIGSATTERT